MLNQGSLVKDLHHGELVIPPGELARGNPGCFPNLVTLALKHPVLPVTSILVDVGRGANL